MRPILVVVFAAGFNCESGILETGKPLQIQAEFVLTFPLQGNQFLSDPWVSLRGPRSLLHQLCEFPTLHRPLIRKINGR